MVNHFYVYAVDADFGPFGEVDLTASAVMRLALAELVERHGYDRIVRMFAEDDVRLRRGRPRS